MNYLLLVRHSLPEIRLDVSPKEWDLSPVGRQRCEFLAKQLRAYAPAVVVTSAERKAVQTGTIVAQNLGIPVAASAGLHEHERDKVVDGNSENFETLLAHFFAQPSGLVFGSETAGQALQRFSGALTEVLNQYPSKNVVVVAHGTVITLWATALTGEDPLTFWKRLGMPSIVVFSRPAQHPHIFPYIPATPREPIYGAYRTCRMKRNF